MTNDEISSYIWVTTSKEINTKNIHKQSAVAIDMVLKSAMLKKSFDNLTAIFIGFYGWHSAVTEEYTKSPTKKKVSFNLDTPSFKHKSLVLNNSIVDNKPNFSLSISNENKVIKNGLSFKSKKVSVLNSPLNLNTQKISFDKNSLSETYNKTSKVSSSFIKTAKSSLKSKINDK